MIYAGGTGTINVNGHLITNHQAFVRSGTSFFQGIEENLGIGLLYPDFLGDGEGLKVRLQTRAAELGVLHLLKAVCDQM